MASFIPSEMNALKESQSFGAEAINGRTLLFEFEIRLGLLVRRNSADCPFFPLCELLWSVAESSRLVVRGSSCFRFYGLPIAKILLLDRDATLQNLVIEHALCHTAYCIYSIYCKIAV